MGVLIGLPAFYKEEINMKIKETIKKLYKRFILRGVELQEAPCNEVGYEETSICFLRSDIAVYITLNSGGVSRCFVPTVIRKDIYTSYYFTGFMIDDFYADIINIAISHKLKGLPVELSLKMLLTGARYVDNFKVEEWQIAAILKCKQESSMNFDDHEGMVRYFHHQLSKLEMKISGIERSANWIYLLKEKDIEDAFHNDAFNKIVFESSFMNKGEKLFIGRRKEQILH